MNKTTNSASKTIKPRGLKKNNNQENVVNVNENTIKIKESSSQSEKKDKEKQSKTKSSESSIFLKIGISVAIIIILVVIYLLVLANKPVKVDYSQYNGYYFNETSLNLWRTTLKTGVGDVEYDFYYHPLEVENISYNNSLNLYIIVVAKNNGNFTVAYSPELAGFGKAAIAGSEVTKVIGTYINVNSGFTELLPDYPELPVHNCTESGPRNHILEFSFGETNEIISDQYCSKIIATDLDNLIMLSDAYIYRVMGIIKDPVVIDTNKLNITAPNTTSDNLANSSS